MRGGLGGEELAERTHVREQAPQPARPHRAAANPSTKSQAKARNGGSEAKRRFWWAILDSNQEPMD
jgi:hypothetical protein